MNNNKFKFIVDEDNNKIAVQMDIDIFESIQPIIEDHALAQAIQLNQSDKTLSFEEAMILLDKLDKQ